MVSGNQNTSLTITKPEFIVDGSDSEFRSFIYSLLISSLHMEKLRDQIGGLIGVNGIQYHILAVISGSISKPSDVISKPLITSFLKTLLPVAISVKFLLNKIFAKEVKIIFAR